MKVTWDTFQIVVFVLNDEGTESNGKKRVRMGDDRRGSLRRVNMEEMI